MRFVHLTPQPRISRIRKSGIRLGGGRRGRGVYAVPLILLEQEAWVRDDRMVDGVPHFWRNIESDARTATTLWKWLAGRRGRHRRLAAVVFETRPHHWPASLYLELPPGYPTDWIQRLPPAAVTFSAGDLERIQVAHRRDVFGDLKLIVQDDTALGYVVQALLSAGFKTWSRLDEKFELVFSSPINANLIQWVTPLYRTNQQFKQRRDRQTDDPDGPARP